VSGSSSSDIVTLSYSADTQREAITVVNAVAVAFQEIGRLTADAAFASAVVELDRSISDLRSEVDSIEQSLSDRQKAVLARLNNDPTRVAKTLLLNDLVTALLALEPPPASATDAAVTRFNNELQVLNVRIATITDELGEERTIVLAVENTDPERAALLRLQNQSQQRLSDLQARRDQLAVDADLASNGVIFYSPAETAVASGSSLFIVLGFLTGLAVGAGLAVLPTSRRRRFASRAEPELVIGARLLADVPNFKEERIDSTLPVIDAPTSASAEAFRFVSASIALQQKWPTNADGSKNFKSLVTLSAGLFEGKTVVTANTALAAAREGHKVLVVDADFGNQKLTELLLGSSMPTVGMTDVTDGGVTLQNAVVDVPHDGSGSVHLLSRGTVSVQAPDFFASQGTQALFGSLATIYDLVLIDAPPLLRVAYATTLARLADRAMVVVAHGEDTHAAEELRDQMELVGIPPIGYVYNFAPLRSEMTASVGSMADTLGENHITTHEVVLRQE
jgi:Mrp family chromosome partitioning ATPase